MPFFPPNLVALVRRQSQKFILSGIRRGLSGNKIQLDLIAKGLGYRRANILSDVKYWRDALSKGDHLKFVNMASRPSPRLYMQTGWQTKGRFETLVDVSFRDNLTGVESTQTVTVVHTEGVPPDERVALNQNLTRGEIEQAAESMVETGSPGGPIEIISSMSVLGFYNPDVG